MSSQIRINFDEKSPEELKIARLRENESDYGI